MLFGHPAQQVLFQTTLSSRASLVWEEYWNRVPVDVFWLVPPILLLWLYMSHEFLCFLQPGRLLFGAVFYSMSLLL